MKKNAVVVGGGIVGITSALLLKEKFEHVYLIEKASDIGGLLNSIQSNSSYFDFGTHIPALTGQEKVDSLLFELDESFPGWHSIPYLKVANYFGSQWNPESPLVDIRSLKDNYPAALEQFLTLPEANPNEPNLGKFIENYFGKIIADEVYRPIFKKLHGTDISNLSQKILYNFCLHRIIALDSKTTKELKTLPKFDSKLGFHSYTDVPENNYRYPKSQKGCGEWISALRRKLVDSGITIINDAEITNIEVFNRKINSLTVKGEKIQCDQLIWTIPPIFLQKLTNSFTPNGSKPVLRTATLINIKLEKPVLRDNHYVFVWDPNIDIFRITFYKNLRYHTEPNNLLSVEYLSDGPLEIEGLIQKTYDQLLKMEILDEGNKILEALPLNLGPAFPVMSPEFIKNSLETKNFLEDRFSNLNILGKSGGKNFLLNNLLLDAYEDIQKI